MAIQVTCSGCLSRFSVSDKFAGKEGPCPKCKKKIKIPALDEQVVVHAPEEFGPKNSKGESVLKPISRVETKITKPVLYGSIGGVVVVLLSCIALRIAGVLLPWPVLAVGAIAIAPPICLVGYASLRDSELAGYTGQELWLRIGICTLVFAASWGLYVAMSWYFENRTLAGTSATEMSIFFAVMIAAGTFTSLTALELPALQAFLHYMAYFIATFLLCFILGIGLSEVVPGVDAAISNSPPTDPPATSTPVPEPEQ